MLNPSAKLRIDFVKHLLLEGRVETQRRFFVPACRRAGLRSSE